MFSGGSKGNIGKKRVKKMIEFFGDIYENYSIMDDFNIGQSDPSLKAFLNSNNLYKLIKNNTCFKGKGFVLTFF